MSMLLGALVFFAIVALCLSFGNAVSILTKNMFRDD